MDWERKKRTKKRFGKILNLFGGDNELEYEQADFNHPGVQMENKEHAALLFKSLQALPENQKVAFVLIKIEGLNYQQTSEVMNTTVKAVEAYMHRAKINLQKNISKS